MNTHITLIHPTQGSQQLSDRLLWSDEFEWSPIVQETHWSTSGALIVDVGHKLAGRPITLDGTRTSAWMPRQQVLRLQAWAAEPELILRLTLRGQQRRVVFDQRSGAGFQARPIHELAHGQESDEQLFVATLRFLELEPST